MTPTKDEALKLALEALGHFEKAGLATLKTIDAIIAIKQALEQPEPEPVAITITGKLGNIYSFTGNYNLKKGDKVYTSPPKREWQGLTDEDLVNCDDAELKQARYWEAKLKEKNT